MRRALLLRALGFSTAKLDPIFGLTRQVDYISGLRWIRLALRQVPKLNQFFGFALRWIKIQIQPTLTLIEPHLCGNLEGENWVKLGQVGSG